MNITLRTLFAGINSESANLGYLDSYRNYTVSVGLAKAGVALRDIWKLDMVVEHELGEATNREPQIFKVIDGCAASKAKLQLARIYLAVGVYGCFAVKVGNYEAQFWQPC